MAVELYPAVDIRGGKAVRLTQGDFAREQVYDADPLDAARRWADAGARWLHVVDLDGARAGEPVNLDGLERITAALDVSVQYGGGLRSAEHVEAAFAHGAKRVVIGTAAFMDESFLGGLLAEYGARIAVGLDVRSGRVAIQAWRERVSLGPTEAIRGLAKKGVETIIYTKVDWDGTMQGADLETATELVHAAGSAKVIYSGGIGSIADLEGLAPLGLLGVIVGKALYEGRFTIEEARAVL
jgi:phosphoribosylformimino-5-aminoimidazole carboxamide ribotide isomerase